MVQPILITSNWLFQNAVEWSWDGIHDDDIGTQAGYLDHATGVGEDAPVRAVDPKEKELAEQQVSYLVVNSLGFHSTHMFSSDCGLGGRTA